MLMLHRHPALQFSHPLPYGAILHDNGVQFVVFSRSATAMRVLLYDKVTDRSLPRSSSSIAKPTAGAISGACSCPGIGAGQLYHLQADGPYDPARGQRFDRTARLIDPYARGAGRQVSAVGRRNHPAAQVRGGRRPVRLAGRSAPAPRIVGNRDL